MSLSFQVLCVIRLYHRERETTDTLLEISLERWCPFKFSPTSKDDSLHFKSSAVQWDCVSPLEQWCISLTECNKSWLHFTQREFKSLVLYFHGQRLRVQKRPLSKPSALNVTSCAEEQMNHFYSRSGDVCLMQTCTSDLASHQGKFRKTHHQAKKLYKDSCRCSG